MLDHLGSVRLERIFHPDKVTQDLTPVIRQTVQACEKVGSWRLSDCTLYVTLEPCPMCAGAIVNARVGRVVFGCKDARAGAMGSVLNLPSYPLNHRPQCTFGVCESECRAVLQEFFAARRR